MSRFLAKLFGDWTEPRIYYWISYFLGSLFGKRVKCRVCGRDFGKIIPFIWRNKLALIGLQKHLVRYVPCGVSEMQFECVSHEPFPTGTPRVTPRATTEGGMQSVKVLHLFLAHQPAPYVEGYDAFHRRLIGIDDELLLVYGGKEEDFATISLDRKLFCPDPRLRGELRYISLSSVLSDAWKWCIKHGERWDFIYFADSDHWGLIPEYTKIIPRLILEAGVDFAACDLINAEFTNHQFVTASLEKDGLQERLRRVAGGNRPAFGHCLGTGFCISWDVLEDFCSLTHCEQYSVQEVYLPSLWATRGWHGLNVSGCSDAYSHVRYRPLFSELEMEQARAAKVPFIHPYKAVIRADSGLLRHENWAGQR